MERRAGYPPFSLMNDDDMASEFMSTTGAPYLAADYLPSGPERQAVQEAEVRRAELLRQMRQVEHRTVQSSRNCISALAESEHIGVQTAEELVRQREQLMNTDHRLDNIHSNLKNTQKDINGIKSVFSSFRNWWSAPKKGVEGGAEGAVTKEVAPPLSSPTSNPNLGAAFSTSQQSVTNHKSTPHPSLRLNGLEEEEEENFSDFHTQACKVNQQLDCDLDQMASGLSRLKGLAVGLGSEIEDQNQLLERVGTKMDRADLTIGSQNTQMKKILGTK